MTATFETKVAIVLRDDLLNWQKLNVCAFLMSGIVGAAPDMIGDPYVDSEGNVHHRLSRQPIVILSADSAMLLTIRRRALELHVPTALYIDPMFRTGHDEANRAVFAQHSPDSGIIAGIGARAKRNVIDKIMKGAHLHP
jgi:hypothetical protein